jgi:hypothetical protein
MNKIALKITVGLVALALAACAAFFSIVGLAKLFAGAGIAVIIMAATLESSKLVIASFLYSHWQTVNKILRNYLLVAITIIALITSMGIYGYLSSGYQTTKSKYDLTATVVDSLEARKFYYQSTLNSLTTQLDSKNKQLTNASNIRSSQEQRAMVLVTNKKNSYSVDKSSKQLDNTISSINKDIQDLNTKVVAYNDSLSKMQVLITQAGLKNELSSELGSLTYISKTFGVEMDKVVNILIVLFIVVFDPLAICMVLVFNFLKSTTNIVKEPISTEVTKVKDPEPTENHPETPSETPQISSEPISQTIELQPDDQEQNIKEKPKISKAQAKAQASYTGGVKLG